MPRKKTDVNKHNLETLKKRVLMVADINLTRSVDCDQLAKVVSQSTKNYINGISFKRLFGFTKYPFSPSTQTLDILSMYVGYKNWYEFEYSLLHSQPITEKELEIYLSFYDLDLVNDINSHEGGFQSVSRKIALRFREDPKSLIRNVSRLVKMPYAQIFFAEHFPDYDNLSNYYYLVFEEYLKHKDTIEAKLYGNCLLFLNAFWQLDKKECGKYLQRINKLKVDSSIHPYVIGRFFACNLLYDSFYRKAENTQEIYSDFLELRKGLPKKGKHFYDFPAAEYIVSEALLHCKEYQKCIEIVELGFNDFSLKMEFVRKGYYRQMQLFWIVANKKLNIQFETEDLLKKIDPKDFYFISQKYFSVLYHYAKNTSEHLSIARDLANEINNKYLFQVFLSDS